MKASYVPPGAYRNPGRKRSVRRRVWKKLNALFDLIPRDRSVVDIGAQQGKVIEVFKDRGYEVFGLDGIPTIERDTGGLVRWCDLTGDCSEFYQSADWGLFFEVGEHVPREFECALFDNVAKIPREGLVVSWAHEGLGMGQRRHVNCRVQVYVASEFARRGWFVDEEATVLLRGKVSHRVLLKERIMVLRRD